jgi:hypothetical protein
MSARLRSDECIYNAKRVSKARQTEIDMAVGVSNGPTHATNKLTAIDIKQIAHSEVCVDALSPSCLLFARFRSLWCVCLLS